VAPGRVYKKKLQLKEPLAKFIRIFGQTGSFGSRCDATKIFRHFWDKKGDFSPAQGRLPRNAWNPPYLLAALSLPA
jgi:hypothetical protein